MLASIWPYLLHPMHGNPYQWWSGIGSDIGEVAIIGGIATLVAHHNCHVRGCWKLGKHPVDGTPYKVCRSHHPTVPNRGATAEQIHAAHKEAQE